MTTSDTTTSAPAAAAPVAAITLQAVESSLLDSIGHDAASNTLAIRFKAGKRAVALGLPGSLYHYENFTAEQFAEMQAAESVGTYFGANVKEAADKHPFRKIDETPAEAPIEAITI